MGHDRALVLQQDGQTAWAPDLGPGQGPTPRPPVLPKEWKPVPPPTFRRLPSASRNRHANGATTLDDGGTTSIDPGASASLGDNGQLANPAEGAQDRALALQQDGQTACAPDLGPGQGPTPRPPVSPKEWTPVELPTFRRLPSDLRSRHAPETVPLDDGGDTSVDPGHPASC